MSDTANDDATGDDTKERMVLVHVNGGYWLTEGEDYIRHMLLGTGPFPTPVVCYTFEDTSALSRYLGPGKLVTDFWGINDEIVDRLRRDEHLLELPPPAE